MKRIGIFGGTFNPIHKGHIHIALNIAKKLMLDKVLVIPNNIPPQDKKTHFLDAQIRYQMCCLACREYPTLVVDDIEINQSGKSYTADTLKKIAQSEKMGQLFLIIGSDKFMNISKWAGFQEIIQLATLCTIPRNYGEMTSLVKMGNTLREHGARIYICHTPILPMSSTEIRKKIMWGRNITDMLHPQVYKYIQENNLYNNGEILKIKYG